MQANWKLDVKIKISKTVDNANLELLDKFRYLGDMLSVDGHADAAVETRI